MPISNIQKTDLMTPAEPITGKRIDREKLKKACENFEALMTSRMLKLMRPSFSRDGVFGKGLGNDIHQTLMDEELSRKISQGKGLGLGAAIYRTMIQREEKVSGAMSEGRQVQDPVRGRSEE